MPDEHGSTAAERGGMPVEHGSTTAECDRMEVGVDKQDSVNGENEQKEKSTEGGIQAGRDVRAGRDIAGRDIIHQDISSGTIVSIVEWREQMESRIEAEAELSSDEKQDLKEQVQKIEQEVQKGQQADASRIEKLINTLAVMSEDIFEVAVATLGNPLAGLGLVAKKIGDRARLLKSNQ